MSSSTSAAFIAVFIVTSLTFGVPVRAQSPPDGAVRTIPASLATILREGLHTSPTLRALVEEIEQSDLIVHIQGTPLRRHRRVAATTRFVLAAGGHRYLRITVDERMPVRLTIALLAHELQHAVEVARAPRVNDVRSFGQLYQHIGTRSGSCADATCYETADAKRMEDEVMSELRRPAADGHRLRR